MGYTTLLIITCLIVYAVDISGFPHSMLEVLWHHFYKNRPMPYDLTWESIHPLLKIFECSTCQTLWLCLIVSLCCGWLTVPVAGYCGMLSLLTPVFKDAIVLVRDFLISVLNGIANYFNL